MVPSYYHGQYLQMPQPYYHHHHETFHQQPRIQDSRNRFLLSGVDALPDRHVHQNYYNHGFEESVRKLMEFDAMMLPQLNKIVTSASKKELVQETEKKHGDSNEKPQISGFQQYLQDQFYPQKRIEDSRNRILLPDAHVLPDRHVHQNYYQRQSFQMQQPYHHHQEAFHQQQRIQDPGNRFLPSDVVVLPHLDDHQYLQADSYHDHQQMAQSYYDHSFEQSVRKLMEFDAVMLPKLKKIVTSASQKKHDHLREEAQNLNKVVMSTTDSQDKKELVQETQKNHDHLRQEERNLNKVVVSTTDSQTKNHHHHVLIKKQNEDIDVEEAYYQKAEKTKRSIKRRHVRSAGKKKH